VPVCRRKSAKNQRLVGAEKIHCNSREEQVKAEKVKGKVEPEGSVFFGKPEREGRGERVGKICRPNSAVP